jgi:UDP-glucose:(heptosyl)LPS alpha-1,3-glucosyltransferase
MAREHLVTVYAGAFWTQLRSAVECRLLPVPNRPAVARLAALWTASAVHSRLRRADIVHIQGADAPVGNVVTAHCCNAAMRDAAKGGASAIRKLNYAIGAAAERYCLTKPSTRSVIAVSRKVKTDIETVYRVDPARITVIPLGVDANAFHPRVRLQFRDPTRERLGLRGDDFVVVFVGRDYRLKGLVALLEAVSRSRAAIQVIAVGVKLDPTLKAIVLEKELSGRVKFVPDAPDPAPYYGAADCFVLPTKYDTFSLATLEAMACGLPVIASRTAGISEHLTDGHDALVLEDPRDAEALARHLNMLIDRDGLRSALGEQARKTAERFSWEGVAQRTLALYRQVLEC